jgi:hypothetical protein
MRIGSSSLLRIMQGALNRRIFTYWLLPVAVRTILRLRPLESSELVISGLLSPLVKHVVIKTRHGTGRAFEIEITKDWLSSPEWELAAYEIPELEAGTTEIIVSHLRKPFSRADLEELLAHLGETYAWFLKQKGCNIELNGLKVKPHGFENWTFPPGFEWRLFLL